MNVIEGINPVTRIAAVIALTTPLLISVDVVSAAIALAATILLAPLAGVSWRQLFKRGWPLFLIAPIAALSMALYGRPEGREYFSFLLAHVTDNSLSLALAIGVRVLAVGLPVVVLISRVDPTDLGDGLAQIARLPERFVIGAVAGGRLVSLFRDDWQSMDRSRRARGIADQGRIRHFFTMAFGLLVLSLRRGSKLATAMEARGFGRHRGRTWARSSTVGLIDAAVILVCLAISVTAIVVSIQTGYFRFLGT
ncbi:Putative HMP/thiamine permease protein YkoC [Corynebacterium faecale]|uniref:energy-coupling factor transporter transmembrane component T family protein n=1 Tax=Corynebacterium faecale TaxID=1758466 RepID=UPI0025B5522B|nr:energy-coupling factor transporter transmembrane component T [Corynebacterium faecale]WJY91822.1 Putative HMP/thiamine permease protein YkoC [Corynebacterium faecale]